MATPQNSRIIARPGMSRAVSRASQAARDIKQYVDAEEWNYYDSQLFAAAASAVGNILTLATFPANGQLAFFNARTISNAGEALTSMSDVNKFENDFRCYCISIDAWMDTDAASAAGIANASAFVEAVVNYSALKLSFGTDVKFLEPVVKMPSGGGIVQNVKIRTQAAAANSDSASASNGLQTAQAKRYFKAPIFFKNGQQFSLALFFQAQAITRIQGLQALVAPFQAGIRVNLEGVRGKPLLRGVAVNR